MLEGKAVQPSQTSVELDFDLEEEREKIRAELRKEFEEQIKSKNQKQTVQSVQSVPTVQPGQSRNQDPTVQYNNAVMPNEVIQGQQHDSTEPNLISDTEPSPAIVNEIDTANAIQKLQVTKNSYFSAMNTPVPQQLGYWGSRTR